MAEIQDPGYLANGCVTAQGDRQGYSSLVCTEGVAFGASGGGDLEATQRGAGANMSVDVASGNAFVQGTVVGWQGMYHVSNDATVNVVVPAADPTNPRIDLIVARVKDSQYAGVVDDWSLACVTGTPAPAPVAPTVPDNSLVLAQVAVAAADTSIVTADITDTRVPWSRCGVDPVTLYLTASTTFEKADHPGMRYVDVEVVGGGGGGGGAGATAPAAGAGGGSGGYARVRVDAATLGASETVTVGAGGAGGGGAANGSSGGSSAFGSHATANGGGGGGHFDAAASGAHGDGGIGGAGTAGDFTATGEYGYPAYFADVLIVSGRGGQSRWGIGGVGNISFNNEGNSDSGNPGQYGGGGSGALNSGGGNDTGAAGATGIVVVTVHF